MNMKYLKILSKYLHHPQLRLLHEVDLHQDILQRKNHRILRYRMRLHHSYWWFLGPMIPESVG